MAAFARFGASLGIRVCVTSMKVPGRHFDFVFLLPNVRNHDIFSTLTSNLAALFEQDTFSTAVHNVALYSVRKWSRAGREVNTWPQ